MAMLADHLQRLGHEVTLAANDAGSQTVKQLLARNPKLGVANPNAAVGAAEIIFLATSLAASEGALANVAHELSGKSLVDCTNPVGPGLTHGLNSEILGTKSIQRQLHHVKVVKAFTVYGFENFENTAYPGYDVKPVMLFCGNDDAAKRTVSDLIGQLGWNPFDVGGAGQALHLEHMTVL
jgi:8-hydroxy-5-deazaflavin:NADPH oxidoreductase